MIHTYVILLDFKHIMIFFPREINGFSICFTVTRVSQKGTHSSPPSTSGRNSVMWCGFQFCLFLVVHCTSHTCFKFYIYTLAESIRDLPITDILILSKKERAPDSFTTVCVNVNDS